MGVRGPSTPLVPARPFIDWLRGQMEALANDDRLREHENSREVPTRKIMAAKLGVSDRCVYRYLRGLDGNNRPAETFLYERVADMLDSAGVPFYEVYPDYQAPSADNEIFCPTCRADVPAVGDRCAWCNSKPGRRPKGLRKSYPGQRVSIEQLRLLHELHTRWQLSINEIASQSWQRLGYSSRDSCHQAIRYGFRKHGLQLLSRSQINRAAAARRRIIPPFDDEQLERVLILHSAGASAYSIAKMMIGESRYHSPKALDRWLVRYLRQVGIYRDSRRPIADVLAELEKAA